MDFTTFIAQKDEIEPALKSGLYIVQQSHLPKQYQAFRMGLAGKTVDSSATGDMGYKAKQASFSSRFGQYLNYFLPTNAQVYACLTVPRRINLGFASRVLNERNPNDGREDYALGYKTLIASREAQLHKFALAEGMSRLGMPGTAEEKKRSEFFKGTLAQAKAAMKRVGVGTMYEFTSNSIASIKKTNLKGGQSIEETMVKLRETPRLAAARATLDQLSSGDTDLAAAIMKAGAVRRSSRLSSGTSTPLTVEMSERDLGRLRSGAMNETITRLARKTPLRRSARLRSR